MPRSGTSARKAKLQIASFHPAYEFAGSAPDDIANFTNRSPYPTLHLLREASIDRAVAAFPDAAAIYERNIETLRRLGHRRLAPAVAVRPGLSRLRQRRTAAADDMLLISRRPSPSRGGPSPRCATLAMTQNPINPVSRPRHDDRTSRTDDEHVVDMVLLPPPEHLIRFFPVQGTPVEALVAGTRSRIREHPERHRRPAARRRRPLLDPRSGGGARLRAAARGRARARVRHARDRDARLFRKAAHDRRLEGADQRSVPRRELPHQRGPADGAPAPDRHRPARHALGQRAARHHFAAIHRRPDRLGRDRRAHDRKPGASRAGIRQLGADRLQERHRRQRQDRLRRDPGRVASAPFSRRAQERPDRDDPHARQSGLPHHPARRRRAELRRGERDGRVRCARARPACAPR